MILTVTRVERVSETVNDPDGRSRVFTGDLAGETTTLEVAWAHVQDGSVVYRLPGDPPRTVRGIPMARIYEYMIQPMEST